MAIIRAAKQQETKTEKIRIGLKLCKTADGKTFTAYKLDRNGRWVDLRFRREANVKDLETLAKEGCTLADIEVTGLSDASERYVHSRFYASDIVGDVVALN